MDKMLRILKRREIFHRVVFRIDEVTFQYRRFDGSMSDTVTRLVLNRGDSVAILLHDAESHSIVLCEQLRVPTYENGPGWLLELPAGILEPGESEEDCARRETLEETGYVVRSLDRIASIYLSPGGSSERVHIFHSEVSLADRTGKGGGLVVENEDIKLVSLPRVEAMAKLRAGEILDAKTLIALQWLELSRPFS